MILIEDNNIVLKDNIEIVKKNIRKDLLNRKNERIL